VFHVSRAIKRRVRRVILSDLSVGSSPALCRLIDFFMRSHRHGPFGMGNGGPRSAQPHPPEPTESGLLLTGQEFFNKAQKEFLYGSMSGFFE